MKIKHWRTYLISIAIPLAVGGLSGLLSMGSMEVYAQQIMKPPLSSPGWVFPVAWTILYAFMGISAARIYLALKSKERSRGLNLYAVQLAVNFFWSLFFFNAKAFGFSALWLLLLWVLVLFMILSYSKVDMKAAWLQLPYLAWLTYAAYLNLGVWYLN